MAQVCEVCGKKANLGNSVTTRGRAKYLGGVGTKVTGISRRKFKPNLQKVHVTTPSGTNKSVWVCTRCLRSGAVTKKVHSAPFKLPPSETAGEKPQKEAVAKSDSIKARKRRKAKEDKAARKS